MTKPLTAREKLIEAIREPGYDFIYACEHADKIIAEFMQSNKKKMRYMVKETGRVIELRRNN